MTVAGIESRGLFAAFCILLSNISGCQARIPARQLSSTVDVENGLQMSIEIDSGQLKQGTPCTFRVCLKNVTSEPIVVPHAALGPDPVLGEVRAKKSVEYDHNEWGTYEAMHARESWRRFYCDRRFSPFEPNGGGSLGSFSTIVAPSKKSIMEQFARFCEVARLNPNLLKTITIPPGETFCREVAFHIPRGAQYVDSALLFDLTSMKVSGGVKDGKLSVPYRNAGGLLVYKDVDIWQGYLYVYLKIPD